MQITNALAWAHYQLRGGWKNITATAGGYAAVIGILILTTTRLDPRAVGDICAFWTMALLGLQIGVLVLYGCWSVSSAVRKDLTTKMIESHRLMPVSGTDAMVGYLIGPTSQVMAIALANVLLGLITVQWAAGGLTTINWLKAQFVLVVFAVCAWSVMAFLPLVFPMGTSLLSGAGFVFVFGKDMLPAVFPGLALLLGPAHQVTVFGIVMTGAVTHEMQISMLAQVLVAVLCFLGAMRKYRRDDVLAWGPLMALGVLAAYVMISMRGLATWEFFRTRGVDFERVSFNVQLSTALIGALIVGIIPVASAARQEILWQRRRALDDPAPNPRPLPMVLVVFLTAVIAASLAPLAVSARWDASLLPELSRVLRREQLPALERPLPALVGLKTFLACFAFFMSMSFCFRLLNRRESRSRWLPILFVAMLWIVPLVADVTAHAIREGFESGSMIAEVAGSSPVVSLIYLWSNASDSDGQLIGTTPGVIVQLVFAGLMGLLYHLGDRSQQQRWEQEKSELIPAN